MDRLQVVQNRALRVIGGYDIGALELYLAKWMVWLIVRARLWSKFPNVTYS